MGNINQGIKLIARGINKGGEINSGIQGAVCERQQLLVIPVSVIRIVRKRHLSVCVCRDWRCEPELFQLKINGCVKEIINLSDAARVWAFLNGLIISGC